MAQRGPRGQGGELSGRSQNLEAAPQTAPGPPGSGTHSPAQKRSTVTKAGTCQTPTEVPQASSGRVPPRDTPTGEGTLTLSWPRHPVPPGPAQLLLTLPVTHPSSLSSRLPPGLSRVRFHVLGTEPQERPSVRSAQGHTALKSHGYVYREIPHPHPYPGKEDPRSGSLHRPKVPQDHTCTPAPLPWHLALPIPESWWWPRQALV